MEARSYVHVSSFFGYQITVLAVIARENIKHVTVMIGAIKNNTALLIAYENKSTLTLHFKEMGVLSTVLHQGREREEETSTSESVRRLRSSFLLALHLASQRF